MFFYFASVSDVMISCSVHDRQAKNGVKESLTR